jgi:hypothetical protein
MKQMERIVFVMAIGTIVAGCIPLVVLAPGADQVRITKNAADVTSCTAVGNVDGRIASGVPSDPTNQMKNEAIGLGGDVVFVTTEISPPKGIAYRCGKVASAAHSN